MERTAGVVDFAVHKVEDFARREEVVVDIVANLARDAEEGR